MPFHAPVIVFHEQRAVSPLAGTMLEHEKQRTKGPNVPRRATITDAMTEKPRSIANERSGAQIVRHRWHRAKVF
jgi:hypothetical protein